MLEEGVSDHRHERVTMKTLPGPPFEVVEAKFLFQLLMGLLADPSGLPCGSQRGAASDDKRRGEWGGRSGSSKSGSWPLVPLRQLTSLPLLSTIDRISGTCRLRGRPRTLVRADYVEKPDDNKLVQSAINGMLAGLDPHSSYMDPSSLRH